jgi:RNA polymerase sigma-70 factor (ECF subfamily)
MENNEKTLKLALEGDINAFQALFATFQSQLKSYLYRLLANRNDAEDLTHDTFIKAFDKLSTYKGEASLKTWVFRIATHLAYNYLQRQKRWTPDVSQRAKELVLKMPDLQQKIQNLPTHSAYAVFDVKEHIDTCFTCIAKNLLIENQVVLMLKDVYDFTIQEICQILDKTEGVVKYLLQEARKTMIDIFDKRCALVNKNGVCNQCSELNGWLNPKKNQQEAIIQLEMVKSSQKYNREDLYHLRKELIKQIDPLHSQGADLQELLMNCNVIAMEDAK